MIYFLFMICYYFRVKIDSQGITLLMLGENKEIEWGQIKQMNLMKWPNKGTIYCVKTKNNKLFYFLIDKADDNLDSSRMVPFINIKKSQFGI